MVFFRVALAVSLMALVFCAVLLFRCGQDDSADDPSDELDSDDDDQDDDVDDDADDGGSPTLSKPIFSEDDGPAVYSNCPEGMNYVPGGFTTVVYQGERWGGWYEESVWVDGFCIDIYEASQPEATEFDPGPWTDSISGPVPPAQSRAEVLPWTHITPQQAAEACAAVGKRLPTLAEWQTAYSGFHSRNWPWGYQWRYNTCHVDLPEGLYPTGGCCFEQCSFGHCFITCDMLGNVSEWLDGYWEEQCYGQNEILVAGGSAHVSHELLNIQIEDPDHPGCWLFSAYSQQRSGLHHHSPDSAIDDDGFRCARSLSNQP